MAARRKRSSRTVKVKTRKTLKSGAKRVCKCKTVHR